MDKYETSFDWWAAPEQKELLGRYKEAAVLLGDIVGEIARRQEESGLGESERMGDAPMQMQRKIVSLLLHLIERDSAKMLHDLLALRGYVDATIIPTQVAMAVQKSIEAMEDMMAPPPGLAEALGRIFGGGESGDPGDILRERMQKESEEPEVKDPDAE